MDKTRTILTWAIFTVVFGMAPLAVNWIYWRTVGSGVNVTSELLLGKGELFLIAALIASDAIGRLFNGFPSNQWVQLFAIVAGAVCLGIVMWSSVQFAYLVPSLLNDGGTLRFVGPSPAAFNVKVVVSDSLYLFAFASASALGVILLVEE